ncbi:cellulase-domain-containing protein [Piromyces finnis]|uniref:Cellulase-domain-containing protein n=1 Tax=Piromyces finnis TaxID=1754191 RepID=A0A1Y1V7U5_9FUNG|nr:cellulase-domain-containing protein [Piromyces finnis]|eukprot:ORX48610.1 cellulase-domain-containing protein [Piromyces finnis]
MKFLNTIALIGLAIVGSKAMRDISSKELVKDIKIGWNLGNTLDAHCLEFLDYSEDQTASETCWLNPRATQELFDKLSEVGFNTFRIPTTWTGHFGEGPEYKIDDAWMKRVHEVVQYAINTGGYAILNVHHEDWNYAFADNLASAEVILEALWKQIAAEFEEFDEHLIFEGMNEPRKVNTDVEWNGGDEEGWEFVNEMNDLFMKTVRASGGNNKLRHLMIPTYAAALNEHTLEAYKYPNNDDKVIVSVHSYTPYNFALATDDTAVSVFNNTQPIEWAMNNINTYFRSKDIPVIIGEFGAMSRNNDEDRMRWAELFVSSAKSMGVPCVLWDNGVFEGDGERFGIIDRSELTITYPLYLKGLMAGIGKNINISDFETTPSTPTTTIPAIIETPTIDTPVNPPVIETPPVIDTPVNPPVIDNATNNEDYLSCAKDDYQCKSKKSEECYKKVSECWNSQQDQSACISLGNTCSKIWN